MEIDHFCGENTKQDVLYGSSYLFDTLSPGFHNFSLKRRSMVPGLDVVIQHNHLNVAPITYEGRIVEALPLKKSNNFYEVFFFLFFNEFAPFQIWIRN